MKVILTNKVKSLGNIGEIVNVNPGYARNCLFPKKLAVLADAGNEKVLEHHKKTLKKKIEEEKQFALDQKKKIDAVTIEVTKKVGGTGKLFGSVTNTELADSLDKLGITVERRLISMDPPIKTLGEFDVSVKLFTEVEGTFKVKVSMDLKQAEEFKVKQELAEKRAKNKKDKPAEVVDAKEASTEEAATETEEENK